EALNLRTRIYRHLDSAGVAISARLDANGTPLEAYDFKGNQVGSTRRLVSNYTAIPDWLLNPVLDAETFEGSTRYDALNRPIQSVAPHSSLPHARRNVIQPVFNEANLLERVDVWLERAAEPIGLLDPAADAPSPVGVAGIDYDAKGQRLRIAYKNGAATRYSYDPLTFRLTHLYTRRGAAFTGDCENPQPPPPTIAAPGTAPQGKLCGLQNLHYTYDPTGNITHIQDDAQQTIYFRNRRVDPSNDYTYDALYRLIQATGREHLGQQANSDRKPPTPPDAFNAFHTRQDHPNERDGMGTYIERYVYDAVGNFLRMQHRGSDPAHPGWTRGYTYAETSLIEYGSGGAPLKTSNRLSRTVLSPNAPNPVTDFYQHDAHGNMVRMPHLGGGLPGPNIHWDYKDQMRMVDLGGGGMAHYVYDASGQRLRKVWEKAPGLSEERLYLGGFEILRKHGGSIGATTATLERETLHVMDDRQRIALVETRTFDTAGGDPAPARLIRYQLGNHLGSASLELDEQAQIISYEEYAPYGSSTYQAVRSQAETPKRYRYTGKEREEETGLYLMGARRCAVWLGRWTSADPAALAGGVNMFAYCRGNPVVRVDGNGRQDRPTTAVGITIDSRGVRLGPFSVGPSAPDDITFTATGPLRRVEMAPHVDEIIAVRGNLAGGVAGSPSDPANKQFLDPRTNVQTKSNFVSNAPTNPRPNVSAAASPQDAGNRLLTGRFSEVDEMNSLASDATARTPSGQRTNTALRENMRADPAIRGALSSVGINPDTLKAENPPGVQQFPRTGSVNLSPRDADVDAATGRVVPGPNTTAALQRRAESQATRAGGTPSSGSSSRASEGRGGSAALTNLRSGTASLAGGVGRIVPGVVEAEMGLTAAAMAASSHAATTSLVTPLLTAAEAVPVVAGAAVLGAGAGHLARAGATAVGADAGTATGIGLGAAVLTGAAIGSVIPGVGTAVGAGIGALVAGGLYLWSL
ncbi:MAG TPA: RHS repeat-associated core domain-containing protein, partial [Herpetosiphonaceae bacterium]|nr:RHS repeat-associated core domain-containing protein [Herpetosiphonaceae bacterium]